MAVIDALEAAGVDAATVIKAVRAHEQRRQAEEAEKRAKAAAKKRRQRAEMSPDVPGTCGDIGGQAGTEGDSEGQKGTTLSLPPSPQTPQPPTHTRVSVTTREREARENAAFERFWDAYPRKVGKADARKAFAKACRKIEPLDVESALHGGLERAKASWVDAQFIPHAATWLNGERWNDEPATITALRPHDRPDRHHAPAASGRAASRGVWAEILAEERSAASGG